LEPAFWHSRPKELYAEIRHSYQIAAFLDLAPGDGVLAALCAKERVPYLGFTLSETHTKLLRERIVSVLMDSILVEGEAATNANKSVRQHGEGV